MMIIKRTTSDEPDFQKLAGELESDLKIRDGDEHLFYAQLNKVDWLKHVVVVYQRGKPVGCGAFREYAKNTAEIKRMYVQSANRNRGIATIILGELENWCSELGYTRCVLETGKNQPEAIVFYKKHHYNIIPNFGRYINSENSICFEKSLAINV